jgi:hypothetical protein
MIITITINSKNVLKSSCFTDDYKYALIAA